MRNLTLYYCAFRDESPRLARGRKRLSSDSRLRLDPEEEGQVVFRHTVYVLSTDPELKLDGQMEELEYDAAKDLGMASTGRVYWYEPELDVHTVHQWDSGRGAWV